MRLTNGLMRALALSLVAQYALTATTVFAQTDPSLVGAADTGIIVLAIGQIATLVAVWIKNQHDTARERSRVTAEIEKEKVRLEAEREKEIRVRQWQVEDRERLARQVESSSTTLAKKVDQASTTLGGKIDHNTQLTADGLHEASEGRKEANGFNNKIERLEQRLIGVRTDAADVALVSKAVRASVGDRLDRLENVPATQEILSEVKKPL